MSDLQKTREQLLEELRTARERIAALEDSRLHHRCAEETLRKLEKAVETMQLGVTVTDLNGIIVYTNSAEARMHGYAVEELIGQDVSVFCLTGYRRPVPIAELNHMTSWRRESVNVRKDGSLLPVMLMSDVVRDHEGRPIGIVTTCEDLTDQKRTEAEREQLESQMRRSEKLESLGVLAGRVANDFNSLLVAILGNASLVQSELAPGSSERERVREIERAAFRASELTNQLLAYAGRSPFITEPVDLNQVIRDAMHFAATTSNGNAAIRYDLADRLPPIDADAGQIELIVQHLVTNASEAIGDRDGRITVGTGVRWAERSYLSQTYLGEDAVEGSYVYLEVADDGCGMDAETQSKIFDPFFTTKITGRGLGLAAVLGIVRGHRGAISIDTSRERGTSVLVLFPAVNARVERAPPRKDERVTWRGEGTVLVADEDPTIRFVTQAMLEHRGFRVITAKSGPETVEVFYANAEEIVAVVLDMSMNGKDTFDQIHRTSPTTPVIVMSGEAEQAAWQAYFGKALAGFVQKPFRSTTLIEKVRNTVQT